MSSTLAPRYCGCNTKHATGNCSRCDDSVAASICDACARPTGPRLQPILRNAHFFPNAALFFPVVERFAVDLVNGSLRDRHAARLSGHDEINVVNYAVRSFHIDTRKIFVAAETGKPIIVHLDQIERQILASVVDVKLFVGRIFAFNRNVSFDSSRNISVADRVHRDTLRSWGAPRRRYCYLWHPRDTYPWV